MPNPAQSHRYVPALDGFRGVAALAVVAFHAAPSIFPHGELGVQAFFVLSGYLITGLLVSEIERTDGLRLGAFYTRRAFRLWPALLVLVALAIGLAAFSGDTSGSFTLDGGLLWSTLAVVFYLTDFIVGYGWGTLHGPFIHTWSLAIEEQFYLVWPIVLLLLVRVRVTLRSLTTGLIIFGAVIAGWRTVTWVLFENVGRSTYAPDVRLDGLALGAALAVFVARGHALRIPPWIAGVAAGAIGLLIVAPLHSGLYSTLAVSLVGALSLVIIAVAGSARPGVVGRILASRILVVLGMRTYGIYLYHFPIFMFLTPERLGLAEPLTAVIKLVVTAIVVELSFRLVESPLRQLGRRLSRRETPKTPDQHPQMPAGGLA